jgi:hypothetical protein
MNYKTYLNVLNVLWSILFIVVRVYINNVGSSEWQVTQDLSVSGGASIASVGVSVKPEYCNKLYAMFSFQICILNLEISAHSLRKV